MKAPIYENTGTCNLPNTVLDADALVAARLHFVEVSELPITDIFVTSKGWAALIADPILFKLIDPEGNRDQVLDGRLGTLYGFDICSNCFDHPAEQERYDFDFMLYNNLNQIAIHFKLTENA